MVLNTINLNPNYYVTKKDIYYETKIVKRPKQPYIFLIRIGDQWLSNSRSRLGERRFSKFIIVFISSCLLHLSRLVCCIIVFISSCLLYYCIYLVFFVVLLYLSRLVCCIIVFISSCLLYCIYLVLFVVLLYLSRLVFIVFISSYLLYLSRLVCCIIVFISSCLL